MDEIDKDDENFRDFIENPIPQLGYEPRPDGLLLNVSHLEANLHSNSHRGPPRIPNMGQIFAETNHALTR